MGRNSRIVAVFRIEIVYSNTNMLFWNNENSYYYAIL
jgi:hypothetical protein